MTIAGARSHFAISDSVFPFQRLIFRAPPDLVAAIYERVRRRDRGNGESPSWQEIVGAAQVLGIFTTEEANAFLELMVDRLGHVA